MPCEIVRFGENTGLTAEKPLILGQYEGSRARVRTRARLSDCPAGKL